MRLAAHIAGIGLLGPGLQSWNEAREVLAGRAAPGRQPTTIPSPEVLPAVERRRAGKCVRIALAAGLAAAADAGCEPRGLAAIFTSSTGDGETLHAICETLASEDRLISPTRFHNSVHNAPAGYWGIATGAMAASDSIAAFDASFAAGLLEALGRVATDPSQPVVLIAYDVPYPEPLFSKRPIANAFAVGLVLDRSRGIPISAQVTREPPTQLSEPTLEHLRGAIPSARALPMLEAIARGESRSVAIEYLDGLSISVEVRA